MRCLHLPPLGSARSRWGVRAWLSYLLISLHLVAFSHHAFVQHRVCVEHGKPVHVEPAGISVAPAPGSVATVRATLDLAHHGHEHCLCPASTSERLVFPALSYPDLPPLSSGTVLGGSSAAVTAQSIALLALAPKSSPPA